MSAPDIYADKTAQLLPKAQRRAKVVPLTDYAKKYSHPTSSYIGLSQSPLAGTFKSGLTPLSPFIKGSSLQKRRFHNYQKRRFYGFSASELQKLSALAGFEDPYNDNGWTDLMTGDSAHEYSGKLDNPIHPLYDRNNWEKSKDIPLHLGPVPIRGGIGGFWLVENNRVWDVLKPCCRLASMLITNAKIFPWWDALMNGQFRDIDPARIPNEHSGELLVSFHTREYHEYTDPQNVQMLQFKLRNASQNIKYRLWSGYCQAMSGVVYKDSYTYGIAHTDFGKPNDDYLEVGLSVETLQPLLTADLNEDERFLAQFRVAATLVHETAHAMWRVKYSLIPYRVDHEPYFEDEVMPELGWSLEDQMWGGAPLEIQANVYCEGGPGLPSMGIMKASWFNDCNAEYNRGGFPVLKPVVQPAGLNPFYTFDYWPIPTTWVKDLQKKDKWEYMIRNFGSRGTQMGPCTFGARFATLDKDPNKLQEFKTPLSILPGGMYTPPALLASFTDEQRAAVEIENARMEKAAEIMKAMGSLSKMMPEYADLKARSATTIEPEEKYLCNCPRYDEIKNYCLNNRAPGELAFDSMDFDIPEPTMYRYIKDRGGLKITVEECRAFLHCCNEKRELFQYEPFPGPGMLTKISTGWPAPTPYKIPRKAPPDKLHFINFRIEIQQEAFHERLYYEFGEFRDIDFDTLFEFVNRFLGPKKAIPKTELPFIINELAREEKPLLTLGPAGIARMRYSISDKIRNESMPSFIKKKRSKALGADNKDNNKRNTKTSKTVPVVQTTMEITYVDNLPDTTSDDDYDMAGVESGELSDVEDIEDLPTLGEKI